MDERTSHPSLQDGILSFLHQMPTSLLVASCIPILVFSLPFLISPKLDRNEPPAIWPMIPVVGHIVGMIRYGFMYYVRMAQKLSAPLITLPILSGRLYMASGRDIISQITRNSKTLTFEPFIGPFVLKATGSSPHAVEVMNDNLDGSQGDAGYYQNISRRMRVKLAPGENMTLLEKKIYGFMSEKLIATAAHSEATDGVTELYDLTRQLLNGGTFTAIYGSTHPYNHNPQFVEDIASYENGLDGLLVGLLPSIFGRKAYLARERLVARIAEYLKDGVPEDANDLIKLRHEEGVNFGLSVTEIARFEVVLIFGIIENSGPGAFWTLLHVWRSPGLVEELRRDLLSALEAADPGHKPSDPLPFSFLTGLTRTVPLLGSAFDEILRLQSFGCQFRQVMADTTIAGRDRSYLLKKDAVVMIPTAVLHSNPAVFPHPGEFDPRRFLADGSKPADLRPFGGGATMCPGRFFARAEMLGLTAMVLLGFDAACVDAAGEPRDWWVPRSYQHSQAASVFPPKDKIWVKMTPRPGWNLKIDMDR